MVSFLGMINTENVRTLLDGLKYTLGEGVWPLEKKNCGLQVFKNIYDTDKIITVLEIFMLLSVEGFNGKTEFKGAKEEGKFKI